MTGISDRSEIISPASGNLILYLPDYGICDRCVSWRNFSGKSPLSYALFVSFFPQLVAGPIERAGNLLGQLMEMLIM